MNTSTTAKVQYTYANGAANTIRATGMVYPSGRVLTYSYGATGGQNDRLSRVASYIDDDGTSHIIDYTFLGAGVFVESDRAAAVAQMVDHHRSGWGRPEHRIEPAKAAEPRARKVTRSDSSRRDRIERRRRPHPLRLNVVAASRFIRPSSCQHPSKNPLEANLTWNSFPQRSVSMPTWATYRGLTVPSSTTGDAGGYLKGDLTALSDRDRLIAPVKVAALSNVASLSGPQTIGGVSLVAGDRVLFTAQTTASQNGPWVVQSGAWTRPDDTPAGTGLAGALVFSQNGVSGAYAANSAWLCTNSPGSDIIGTNSLTFARITGLALATASSPLSITNDTLSLSGVVPVAFGGTGSSTALSNNRIIVSSGGTYAEAAALTSGQLLIGSTGAAPVAASLTGTTNQITVTGGAGSITLALPQNIHTAATPTFGGLTLTGAATVTSVAAASLTTSGTITATGAISSSSTITASGLGTFAGVTVSGTNVLTLPVGAAGTPSLTYTGDTDTGLFSPAAGRLAVSTDGTVALTASSGRIGIGSSATAPNAALSVGTNGISDSNVPVQINASSGGEAWYGVNKAGGYGLLVGYSGNAAVLRNAHATDPLNFVVANTTTAGYIASNGGLVWGTPTGGSKGSGTINCQNLYVNNTQLNVPDYVFDIAFDGRVREEQDLEERDVPDSPHRSELIWRGTGQPATTDELVEYRRRTGRPILSVGELDQFVRSHRHLPTLRSREERYMQGAASIADLLREQHETIEHLSLYILELHRRLSTLEQTVTAAATNN